jgi:hypothetical protein
MKQQLKHQAVAGVIFLGLMLLAALASGETPQKPPPLASAVRSGKWQYSQKESALPNGPLCSSTGRILGRHVTLKVAGARLFESTLAIVKPQHKKGNTLSVFVDNEEVQSVQIQYGAVQQLSIPIPAGAQTLTLMETRPFPHITFCSPSLS